MGGGFLTTEPPGKSLLLYLFKSSHRNLLKSRTLSCLNTLSASHACYHRLSACPLGSDQAENLVWPQFHSLLPVTALSPVLYSTWSSLGSCLPEEMLTIFQTQIPPTLRPCPKCLPLFILQHLLVFPRESSSHPPCHDVLHGCAILPAPRHKIWVHAPSTFARPSFCCPDRKHLRVNKSQPNGAK